MSTRSKDRISLCSFTFADSRRCRTPRCADHPHFCFFHARKEAQAHAAKQLGHDISYFFSGDYLSACDLSTALGRLFSAVARGEVKPRTASTLAYLGQTLLQTIPLAQHEYINAFSADQWRGAVRSSVFYNVKRQDKCHDPALESAPESAVEDPAQDSPQDRNQIPEQCPKQCPVQNSEQGND